MHSIFRTSRLSIKKDYVYAQVNYLNTRIFKRSSVHELQIYNSFVPSKTCFRKAKFVHLRTCSYFNEAQELVGGIQSPGSDPISYVMNDIPEVPESLLYSDSSDPISYKLNKCSSILEVLDLVDSVDNLKPEHVAQAVLVLWDLKKMFYYGQYHVNQTVLSKTTTMHNNYEITSHPKFEKLLRDVEVHYEKFDVEVLSSVLLYLHKIGVPLKQPVMQLLITELRRFLRTNISLNALARFVVTLFSDFSIGSFFILQDALPFLVKELENCDTVENLKLITICMIHLQQMLGESILYLYKDKIVQFQKKNKFQLKDYRALLKVIIFLSYPQWNNDNVTLVSEMVLMLRNQLYMFSIFDFLVIYEIFYKNQEPGELLTDLQRCGSRLLLHFGEEIELPIDIKIKLLTSVVCFSSPTQRSECEKMALQCINEPLSKQSILEMLKILTFIKPTTEISKKFWDNVTNNIRSTEMYKDVDFVLGLCHKYMNYNNDVQYRHSEFENEMLIWAKSELKDGFTAIIPSRVSLLSAFILGYCNDQNLIDFITEKISTNWEQLNHIDCLYISKGVRCVIEITKNSYVTEHHLNTINVALDKAVQRKFLLKEDSIKVNFLVKSCIYRNKYNVKLYDQLSHIFDSHSKLSSNSIRNLLYSFQTSSTLLPNFLENVAEYIINYKDHVLGFNAEKVAFFCYILGYVPKRADELFQAITDIIIRDQERISGLSYLQAALALCYFYKLPESFIKRIFNVSFLEKLDMELSNCYSKDVYPIRVRKSMMQLNRAVCLDYPQANVPWFHQKYAENAQKDRNHYFKGSSVINVIHYLHQLVENNKYVTENVYSPYGYQIDVLLKQDASGNLIEVNGNEQGTRIAVLILKPNAYTNINVHLKGSFQLKTRHLEILGYKVIHVNLNEWDSMLFGKEKLQYLKKLIFPENLLNVAEIEMFKN